MNRVEGERFLRRLVDHDDLSVCCFVDREYFTEAVDAVCRPPIVIRETEVIDNGGWIEWRGGECPVPNDVRVDVEFRSESLVADYPAGKWQWSHSDSNGDIIRYRVIESAHPAPDLQRDNATLRDALRETARALVGVARDPHSTRLGTQTIAAMAKVLAALPEEVTK